MVSKVAQIREEMNVVQSLVKGQILFVAIPVLNEDDYKKLRILQATRAFKLSEEAGHG